jgi:hypothetical protein
MISQYFTRVFTRIPCECHDNHGEHRWAVKNEKPAEGVRSYGPRCLHWRLANKNFRKNYMSAKITGLPHGVSGFFAMKDHRDEAKAENCSNYAANDGEEYRNTMNFKQD